MHNRHSPECMLMTTGSMEPSPGPTGGSRASAGGPEADSAPASNSCPSYAAVSLDPIIISGIIGSTVNSQ